MKRFIITSDFGKPIRPIQEWLIDKYMDIDPIWLDLGNEPIEKWCRNLADMVEMFGDEYSFLMLDDHLVIDRSFIPEPMADLDRLELGRIASHHVGMNLDDVILMNIAQPYTVSTQPSIWNTEALIKVLRDVDGTPWDFEIKGRCYAGIVKGQTMHIIEESALSKKWEGINLNGMKPEDINELIELNLLNHKQVRC